MQLTTEQESPSEEYLSDYAYIDTDRLAHYYAQLSKDGLITQSKKSSKTADKSFGNVGFKAVVTATAHTELGTEHAIEHMIDPAFSRPQQTLDALYENGYLGTDLKSAGIGELVLIKGRVSIFDIRLLRDMWQHMGNLVSKSAGEGQTLKLKDRQRLQAASKKEFEEIAPLVAKLPHSIQGTFLTPEEAAWFTLEPKHMRINPEDIVFKHGCDLPGEWHMLGIVDARPEDALDIDVITRVSTEMEGGLRLMLLHLRGMMGRPFDRYGITPVVIFRTMKKIA